VITTAQVRRIALALPGAYEQATYDDWPSWRTKPRMFAWIRAEPEALVVWVDSLDAKEAMLANEPELFFTTPHYDGHPIVLVRLDVVDPARAAELIEASWRLRAPKRLVAARAAAGPEPASKRTLAKSAAAKNAATRPPHRRKRL
jgi:hypothetical protein